MIGVKILLLYFLLSVCISIYNSKAVLAENSHINLSSVFVLEGLKWQVQCMNFTHTTLVFIMFVEVCNYPLRVHHCMLGSKKKKKK